MSDESNERVGASAAAGSAAGITVRPDAIYPYYRLPDQDNAHSGLLLGRYRNRSGANDPGSECLQWLHGSDLSGHASSVDR